MREVKEKSPLKERTVKTLKSAPQAAFRRGTDASFQQLRRRSCTRQHRMGSRRIATRAAKSRIPPIMPCREARHLAEKGSPQAAEKQNPNRSGKPGQNLFHNTNVPLQPQQPTTALKRISAYFLRNRARPSHRASEPQVSAETIVLCANRLLRSEGEAGSSCKRPTAQNAGVYAGCESTSVPISVSNSAGS